MSLEPRYSWTNLHRGVDTYQSVYKKSLRRNQPYIYVIEQSHKFHEILQTYKSKSSFDNHSNITNVPNSKEHARNLAGLVSLERLY